jgi:multiple sugar transport system substrate-binding protein
VPKLSKKTFIGLGVLLVLLLAASAFLIFTKRGAKPTPLEQIDLTYWGIYDSPDVIQPIIDKYQAEHPNVTIHYEQKEVGKEDKVSAYEKELIDAFATGNGPDIFELQNMMIPKYQSLIEPLPESDSPIIDDFFDVVAQDAVIGNRIYALPYSVDSLALYYNKSLFNKKGIANPPRTWDEFNNDIEKFTKLDASGKFIQSGAAIGGSSLRINRATDILALLMLQQGTTITDPTKDALIWDVTATNSAGEQVKNPGITALREYLKYSNATEPMYTWNESQAYSFDLFAQEKVAMVISYAYALPTILGNNPKMQLGIAPLPQIKDGGDKTTYANYWLETVSKESKHSDVSWDFLKFATNKENDKLYSSATNKPVSRRDLVNDELNDANLSTFAGQNLYATSWYQYDGPAVEKILDSMLKVILSGQATTEDAFQAAQTAIQQILNDAADARKLIQEAQQKAEDAAKALQQANNSTKTQ